MGKGENEKWLVEDREVTITNPTKIFFPEAGVTKRDVAQYYLQVAEPALAAVFSRPMQLVRYVNGAHEPPFYQKRAPDKRPEWIETVTLRFPSGRTADEIVVRHAAQLLWVVNLGCIELHPHPVRTSDLEHPDEFRIDLDPVPGVEWVQIQTVAQVVREVLTDHGLTGWLKTSGSRGLHVFVRIEPRWEFDEVRRAALAFAREVEQRAPKIATSKWWKEERHGVFIDYNQNAKDRTTAAAYSVRPTPDARVSTPIHWEELPDCHPRDFTIRTVPARVKAVGDAAKDMDGYAGRLDSLLDLAERQRSEGHLDAPWPPHYGKRQDEPKRVPPSKRTRTKMPLIVIAQTQTKKEALTKLDQWKEKHASILSYLAPEDVLVDSMRGRYRTWTRIRINLKNVPVSERPSAEPLDSTFDPE